MLKTLGAQVKQYRWVTFITPVFSALEAVADMFLPMLMSQIIDKGKGRRAGRYAGCAALRRNHGGRCHQQDGHIIPAGVVHPVE